jgi:predicted component of type VI protein secretion system
MAYIILTANGEELQRIELNGAVVIGRAAECDVAVRDVLLSRKHCRLERGTGKDKARWKLVDLASRNGTHVNWKKVSHYTLVDGDAVRLGRTWLTFKAEAFVAAGEDVKKRKSKLVRPADPHEALNGTVADFIFVDRDDQQQDFDGTPSPHGIQPMGGKAIYSPLSELSNSWDSIVATAVRPKRMARPIPRANGSSRNESQMDLSLQAHPMQVPYLEVVAPIIRRRRNLMPAVILTIGIGLATLLVLVSGWVMTKGSG